MELRHLRYFLAVAEEENITRAAARLHVSQPPLTRQMRDLEEELGVELLERRGKAIRLTALGRLFLDEVRSVLGRVEEALEKVRAAARGPTTDLHLGYAPSPTVELLPKILGAMQHGAPAVRVVLHDHTTPEMLDGLREGRLQAALMMQPPRPACRGLTFLGLRRYPMGILVASNHRLARLREVAREDLRSEPVVAFARAQYPDYHALLRRVLGRGYRQLQVVLECDGGPSLMAAVASGKGVALGPSVVATASSRRLRFVPLRPAAVPAVVGLAWRTSVTSAPLRHLVQVARELGEGEPRGQDEFAAGVGR
ncbi:MAG: LysR family transcriptional regulator [Verrucomicrobiales bacterium]|nr:LysR family transcriptional regulator [Verrucomicrobiales bacterium]